MNDQLKHYSHKLDYEIDSWDLNVAREAGENITVVDARSPEAFHREHIPGAINIPHRTMSPETTRHVDKNALVVTYMSTNCLSPTPPRASVRCSWLAHFRAGAKETAPWTTVHFSCQFGRVFLIVLSFDDRL